MPSLIDVRVLYIAHNRCSNLFKRCSSLRSLSICIVRKLATVYT